MNKKVVCLCGKMGSGKTTIAKLISQKYNFKLISISEPIKYLANALENEHSREVLNKISFTMRNFFQNTWLWITIGRIYESHEKYFVIDDIRFKEEILLLKEFFDVEVILLKAEENIRIERILKRKDKKDPKDIEKIKEQMNTFFELAVDEIESLGLFDFLIDTSNLTVDEVFQLVEKYLINKKIV